MGHRTAMCILLCIFVDIFIFDVVVNGKTFEFPRYNYRKKPKMERRFKSERTRCEKTPECSNVAAGVTRTKCTRTCMSKKCYDELYSFDELEDGEIDVRLASFKGCWSQEYTARQREL
ncbi:uncharacterized protein [Ptychodera flava]|uniref:uncharacterized protein n=1 Tax=Ptychodera flava TaxID=63121 RepID=UPI00396A773C